MPTSGQATDQIDPNCQVSADIVTIPNPPKERGRPRKKVSRSQSDSDLSVESVTRHKKRRRVKTTKQVKKQKNMVVPDQDKSSTDDDQSGKASTDSDDISTDEEEAPSRQNFGLLVGETVPSKVRSKILADKFIELADLLPQNYKNNQVVLTATSDHQVKFLKPNGPKYITLDQWNSAFLIYMSIYADKATTLSQSKLINRQLLTYYRDVNTMAKENYQWRTYDRQYRKDRAAQPKPMPYSTIRHDLMLDAMSTRNKDWARPGSSSQGSFRRQFTTSANTRTPLGYCLDFHNPTRFCNRPLDCKYKHVCPKCGGRHPTFKCNSGSTQPRTHPNGVPRPTAYNPPRAQPTQNRTSGAAGTTTRTHTGN